jgi:hypothetical protein
MSSIHTAPATTSAAARATLSAEEVIWVIAQAAPTPWIRLPRLDSRLASQMRRKMRWRSGAAMPSALSIWGMDLSVILAPAEPRYALNLDHGNDAGQSRLLWSAGRAVRNTIGMALHQYAGSDPMLVKKSRANGSFKRPDLAENTLAVCS